MLALDRAVDDDGGAFRPHIDAGDGEASALTAAATAGADAEDFEPEDDDANEQAEDDDDDEWEDVGYEPVFRDLKFSYAAADGDDDDDDSEYAPSATADDDDDDDALQLSDLEDEEEEESPSGLFASVMQHVGGGRKSVADQTMETAAFDEQDERFWSSAEEKRQWVERFHAADKQHVRTYGCRIDSPALPEAKAKLRREKKRKNAYALVLFALCVAYLVQLVVMYAATAGVVLSMQEIVDSVEAYVRAIPPPTHMYQRVLEHLSPPLASVGQADSPASLVSSVSETLVEEQTVGSSGSSDAEVEKEHVVEAEVTEQGEVDEVASDSLAAEVDTVLSEEMLQEVTVTSVSYDETPTDAELVPSAPESPTAEGENEYAAVAVQLCSKFLIRLVKSKYDQTVKDAAFRACDAAVAMAPLDSALLIEAHVLRGDLWSLVSEFPSADADYNAATTSSLAQTGRQELSQEIQLKAFANRWISLFTKHSYKELRQDAGRVAKDTGASAALRALASDWLLVFKKKKEPFEVLTSTRLWTLQRLKYTDAAAPLTQ